MTINLMRCLRRQGEGNRMISTFSHNAVKVGQQYTLARVNQLMAKRGSPVSVVVPVLRIRPYPMNAACMNAARKLVEAVGRCRNASQVTQSVVNAVTVNVINQIRLLAVSKKPANPMGKPRNAFIHDAPISSFSVNRACNRPRLAGASINFPSQIAR